MFLVVETFLFQNEGWNSIAKQCKARVVGPRNNPKYPQCRLLLVWGLALREREPYFFRPLHE